jgi:hypothetical protein
MGNRLNPEQRTGDIEQKRHSGEDGMTEHEILTLAEVVSDAAPADSKGA